MDTEATIKAEALRIGKEGSSLAAVKYIRDETGFSLTDAKATWDKWRLEPIANPLQKLIKWHPVSELPEKDPEEPEYSIFLLFRESNRVLEGYYNLKTNKIVYRYDAPDFLPTHWAYIDFLPE